jgi:hypothetical protein
VASAKESTSVVETTSTCTKQSRAIVEVKVTHISPSMSIIEESESVMKTEIVCSKQSRTFVEVEVVFAK